MTLKVYTARYDYGGKDRLDVTRTGNDPLGRDFAPSWGIVAPYLLARSEGRETEALWRTYELTYCDEMDDSLEAHSLSWSTVLERESVTLVCFCMNSQRCHRSVLAKLLTDMGATDMGERQLALFP
jgi:uncharacterized protein YeaO (DUF488 family)